MARIDHAREILAASRGNDWGGGEDAETIAQHAYAVAVERDSDGWVLGVDDARGLAEVYLSTYVGTEGYDEWIEAVWSLDTGERAEWTGHVKVAVMLNGKPGTASTTEAR